MLIMKCLITLAFLILGSLLYATAKNGRQAASLSRSNTDDPGISWACMLTTLYHQQLAKYSFLTSLFAVLLTESYVRLNGGVHNKGLFHIHLGFALPLFAILAVLRFWLTGLSNPRQHKTLGYICLASYVGTVVTGLILLWS